MKMYYLYLFPFQDVVIKDKMLFNKFISTKFLLSQKKEYLHCFIQNEVKKIKSMKHINKKCN